MSTKRDCEWRVKKTMSGYYLLEYLPGCLGENGAILRITEEIYRIAKCEEISLEELFIRFDLYKIKPLTQIKPTIYPRYTKRVNTSTEYQGADFFVTEEGGKYYLEYLLSRHGGGCRKFEISKKIYEAARTGKYTSSDLFKKYNLYHLDIPENDV